MHVKITEAASTDEPLIYSSWLKAYRHSNQYAGCRNRAYYDAHSKVIADIIKRGVVLVARDYDDDGHLYGFIAFDARDGVTALHWTYTKYSYRRFGIARALLEAMRNWSDNKVFVCSHYPPDVDIAEWFERNGYTFDISYQRDK